MKPTFKIRLISLTMLLLDPGLLSAAPGPMHVSAWQGTGLSEDAALPGPDGSPSIAVAPNARAVLRLRTGNDSGKITFYVHDDGTVGAPGKIRGAGPRWGIVQADGRVFVAGIMYAPYLEDGGSLALMDVDPAVRGAFFNLKYAAARRSTNQWQKWEFDFNPYTGLKISIDGVPLALNRFDWDESHATGFTGLVLYGDATETPHILNVSGIEYKLDGPMKVKPTPPSK